MPQSRTEQELNERLWVKIFPLLPEYHKSPKGGRPRRDDKLAFFGIVYVLRNGSRWQDVPKEYGSPATVWRRFAAWQALGIWQQIWEIVLAELDQAGGIDKSETFADGTFVPAKKGVQKLEKQRLARV